MYDVCLNDGTDQIRSYVAFNHQVHVRPRNGRWFVVATAVGLCALIACIVVVVAVVGVAATRDDALLHEEADAAFVESIQNSLWWRCSNQI